MNSILTAVDASGLAQSIPREVHEFLEVIDVFATSRLANLSEEAELSNVLPEKLPESLFDLGLFDLIDTDVATSKLDLLTATLLVERLAESAPLAALIVSSVHSARFALGANSAGISDLGSCPVVIHVGERTASLTCTPKEMGVTLSGIARRVDGARSASSIVISDPFMGAVVVDPSSCRIGEVMETVGMRGWVTSSVELVERDALVSGSDADGFELSRRIKLLLLGATAVGIAFGCSRAATSYAVSREQFGRPIATFPAVALMLEQASGDSALAAREVFAAAMRKTDAGSDAAIRAARFAARLALGVADLAIQVHGGYGYLSEYPIEKSFRDAMTLQAMLGGVQIQ